MPRYAEGTKVSGESSRGEVTGILAKHGGSMSSDVQAAKVKATFTDLRTNVQEVRELDLTYDGRVVKLHGGPTGYEDFRAADWRHENCSKDWEACFGTPGRYRRCVVDGRSLTWALMSFGIEEVMPDPA